MVRPSFTPSGTPILTNPVINPPPNSRRSKTPTPRSRTGSLLCNRQRYIYTLQPHPQPTPKTIADIRSDRNLRPLSNIPTARIPQPIRRSSNLPRQQTWQKLVYLGVPRRRHRIPRQRSLRSNPPLPLARPPPTTLRADPEYNGQYAKLASAPSR